MTAERAEILPTHRGRSKLAPRKSFEANDSVIVDFWDGSHHSPI